MQPDQPNSTDNMPPVPLSAGVDDSTEPQKPGAINLPPGLRESEVLDTITRLEEEFTNWFKSTYDKIEDNWNLFENTQAAGITNPDAPVIPLVFSITETLKSRMMSGVFSQEKLFDFLPDGIESLQPFISPNAEPGGQPLNAADVASIMEDFICESIYDTPDFFQRMDSLCQNFVIENTMLARVRWEQYEEAEMDVTLQNNILKQPMTTDVSTKTKSKGCPIFEPRSIREAAWDPRAQFNPQAASWFRLRTMTRPDELKKLQLAGIVDKVDDVEKQTAVDQAKVAATETSADPIARQSRKVEGVTLPTANWSDKLVKVDEYWAEISWKTENGDLQYGDFTFWVANGKTIIKFEAIPKELKKLRRPFAMAVSHQKSNSLLGLGPLDEIKALIKDIANVFQAKKKLIWQTANSPIFYEPVSMLEGKRTLLEGANLVPVLSAKGINRQEPPVQAIAILDRHLSFLIQMVREATASNEQAQGISGDSGDETATEARILASASAQRMQYSSNVINSAFFVQLAELYQELYKECGQEGEMVTREAGVDGKPVPVTLPMLAMRYRIRPVSAVPQANKMARFRLLKDLLGEIAAMQPGTLVDGQGRPMQVNTYEYLINDVLPLIDVRGGQRLFRVAPPMLMPMAPAPGVPGPSKGAAPKGGPIPETKPADNIPMEQL